MPFAEDLPAFLADFGQDCVLAGAAVRALLDTETGLAGELLAEGPSALLVSADAAAAAPGQSFTAAGVSHVVRQVLREPPDGAFTRLILARA